MHDTQTDTPLSITTYQNEAKEPSKAELYYHKNLTDEELLFLKKRNKRRTYYYHRDHQGSITHLTDEEGKVVESFTYDAYGIILEHTQTQDTLNPYGYTGREFDKSVASKTGIVCDLYYYRARYYDPMQGRFISQDPIEFLAGDVNFYRYVGGDPVNFVDPTGLCGEGICIGIAALLDFAFDLGAIDALVGLLGRKTVQQVGKVAVRGAINQMTKDETIAEVEVKVVEGVAVKGSNGKCGNSNKNKGDCAEALVNKKYGKNGWTEFNTKDIENGSGHGIDNILTKGDDMVIVETKANTAGLNKGQRLGGSEYLKNQLAEMIKGFTTGKGRWAKFKNNKEFGKALKKLKKLLDTKDPNFKICRVKLDEDPTGCYGKGGNGKCKGEVDCSKDWIPK